MDSGEGEQFRVESMTFFFFDSELLSHTHVESMTYQARVDTVRNAQKVSRDMAVSRTLVYT